VRTGGQAQSGSISVDRIKQLLPDLRQGRNQAYVGWDLKVLPLDNGNGVPLVLGVDPDSPGDSAGLRFGDVVRRVQDTLVRDVPDVCDILGSKASGDRVKVSGIRLSRGGGTFTARVRLR
jgi:S1-C subfamily serine protease